MRYTLGNKFESREEQGEFVFLALSSQGPQLPQRDRRIMCGLDNYVELECQDGFFWVSSKVEDKQSTSTDTTGIIIIVTINGTRLIPPSNVPVPIAGPSTAKRNKVKLALGDVLSIYVGGVENPVDYCDLIFKTKAASSDREEGPLEHTSIIAKILSFLPTRRVQTLRPVSRIWNEEGLRVLQPRVTLAIFKGMDNYEEEEEEDNQNTAPNPDNLMEIFHLAQSPMITTHQTNFSSWDVKIPNLTGFPATWRNDSEVATLLEVKLLDDLRWFLSPPFQHQNNITKLCLHGRVGLVEPKLKMKPLAAILSQVSQNLTTLNLSLEPDSSVGWLGVEERNGHHLLQTMENNAIIASSNNEDGSLSLGIQPMPQMKTLTLSICALPFFPLASELLLSAPGIKTLLLPPCPHHHQLPSVATRLALQQVVSSSSGQNLTELVIGTVPFTHRLSLSNLPPTLKSLKLMNLNLENDDTCVQIRFALAALHESLEKLSLHFLYIHNDETMTLNFPIQMPKLTSLNVLASYNTKFWAFPDARPIVKFRFGSSFRDSVIRNNVGDYSTHFPSLKKLMVWPGYFGGETLNPVRSARGVKWDVFLPLLEGFISLPTESSQPVSTLVNSLVIPFVLDGRYHPFLDNLEAFFPNVSFPPELATARMPPPPPPPPQ